MKMLLKSATRSFVGAKQKGCVTFDIHAHITASASGIHVVISIHFYENCVAVWRESFNLNCKHKCTLKQCADAGRLCVCVCVFVCARV